MNATVNKERKPINGNHRKEEKFFESYIGLAIFKDGKPKKAVSLRLYCTGERVYCCVWLKGTELLWQSGSAFAGGYGYHKASAAANEALHNAGVTLSESIDGRGDEAIAEAVEAVTLALYPDCTPYVVHAHG